MRNFSASIVVFRVVSPFNIVSVRGRAIVAVSLSLTTSTAGSQNAELPMLAIAASSMICALGTLLSLDLSVIRMNSLKTHHRNLVWTPLIPVTFSRHCNPHKFCNLECVLHFSKLHARFHSILQHFVSCNQLQYIA